MVALITRLVLLLLTTKGSSTFEGADAILNDGGTRHYYSPDLPGLLALNCTAGTKGVGFK